MAAKSLRTWYRYVTGTPRSSGTLGVMSAQSQYELVVFSDGEILKVQVEGDLGSSGVKHLAEIRTAAEKLGIDVEVEASNTTQN